MQGVRPNWNQEIPQYWLDKGMDAETIEKWYIVVRIIALCLIAISVFNYVFTWWIRKNLSPLKKIGDEPLTRIERYAQACKLGQEPAMNFISSTLITNDRVYIILRMILALWSLFLTASAPEGLRTPFFATYYPTATIITIYVNFNRELIVEGFGSKVQTVNKIISWLFNCTAPLRLFIAISWWTKWFGIARYREMSRPADLPVFVLFNKEFAPTVFMLTELLWFDTMVTFCGAWAATITGNLVVHGILNDMVDEPPQALAVPIEHPAAHLHVFYFFVFGMPLIQWVLATFCLVKVWIFKKLPVIGERLRLRQEWFMK